MGKITILVPAYNEEAVIEKMYERLNEVCANLERHTFEFLFVNDGSQDRTLQLVKQLKGKDDRVQYVDLSRNFGKEAAMIAGLDYTKGDAVIIIDADLQQPPELFEEMIHWWEEGYDDVYAVRKEREGESWLKKWTSRKYYHLLQKVSQQDVYPQVGDYRLLDKKCIDALKQLRERERYTKGLYSWIGFKKKEICVCGPAKGCRRNQMEVFRFAEACDRRHHFLQHRAFKSLVDRRHRHLSFRVHRFGDRSDKDFDFWLKCSRVSFLVCRNLFSGRHPAYFVGDHRGISRTGLYRNQRTSAVFHSGIFRVGSRGKRAWTKAGNPERKR